MTIEEQNKINNSSSQTWPFVLAWMIMFPVSYVLESFFNLGTDVATFMYAAFTMSFAYMGLEFMSDAFSNKKYPDGFGKIENITRHKGIVVTWILFTVVFLLTTYVFKLNRLIDIANKTAMFSASLSVEYVLGTKGNKAAISLKKDCENKTEEK